MSNQLQMNTKSQFKETFDEMLLNNKSDEYIFKYRGHTYALVNLEDNKIMVTNLWSNDSIWDDSIGTKKETMLVTLQGS